MARHVRESMGSFCRSCAGPLQPSRLLDTKPEEAGSAMLGPAAGGAAHAVDTVPCGQHQPRAPGGSIPSGRRDVRQRTPVRTPFAPPKCCSCTGRACSAPALGARDASSALGGAALAASPACDCDGKRPSPFMRPRRPLDWATMTQRPCEHEAKPASGKRQVGGERRIRGRAVLLPCHAG